MNEPEPLGRLHSLKIAAICAASLAVIFGSWEYYEHAVLQGVDHAQIHRLHVTWAVISALALAILSGALVARARRRAEAALRAYASAQRALIDTVQLGILLLGPDLRIRFANASVRATFGDVEGADYSSVFPPPVGEEGESAPARVHRSGQVHEELRQHQNGRLYRLVSAPAPGEAGEGLIATTVVDVTADRELREQLVQSEKLAAIGQLAAGIAHEIRTPLSTIRVAAYDAHDLVADNNPEASECIELIESNAIRCNDIIRTLLDFARESPMEQEEVNLGEVLDSCLQLARKSMSLQGVHLERSDDEVPNIWARGDDVRQIFSNLILNAVQAMPRGGILRLTTSHEDGEVRVVVSDTGCGIPRSNLGRIFDPFFTTKEPGQGTGLGLSVCRRAVERMGGQITAQSEVGVGSDFTVTLPVRSAADEDQYRSAM